jgi:LPXTG-motif cell wall-anchored protein
LEGHRAWATTPAGWRLTAAAADITGAAGRLDLVESCSAAVPLIPAPHVLPAPAITSTKPSAASVIGATVQKGGAGVSISPTRPRTDAPPPFAPAAPAALPTTGTDVAGMLTLGTSLSLAGVLLLIVRRQRIRAAARRVAAEDIRSAIVVTWHDWIRRRSPTGSAAPRLLTMRVSRRHDAAARSPVAPRIAEALG